MKTKVASSWCLSSRASTSVTGLIVFCTCVCIRNLESAQFSVIGSAQPLTAVVGQDIVLPCHLSPRMSAESMEVRWFRNNFKMYVHLYSNGRDRYEQQMPDYHGRTEMLKDDIVDGNISLKIFSIRHSDGGRYFCFAQNGTAQDETELHLNIAVLGSVPFISVEDYQEGGIRLVCRSAGWFPEPKVVWRDSSGQHLPSLSDKTKAQRDNGPFETETAIIIKEYTNSNLSCWIRDKYLSQGKESTISISDAFFPWVNTWMVAVILTLVVSFGLFVLTIYFCKLRGDLLRQLGWRRDVICPGLGRTAPAVEEGESALTSAEASELLRIQSWVNAAEGDCLIHPRVEDYAVTEIIKPSPLDKAPLLMRWFSPFPAVKVTLDPDTAHPRLNLFEGQSVTLGQTQQQLPDSDQRFDTEWCVLGCERLLSGRHWWEVEVLGGGYWAVGIARASAGRKGWIFFGPKKGIWGVQRSGAVFRALTGSDRTRLSVPAVPSRIRVYLDCAGRQVWFLDADTEAPIFTFLLPALTGDSVRPWLWAGDTDVRITFPTHH